MAEQKIIRTQIIGVKDVGQNSYGDLTFTDEAGGEYKVSAKRKQYFEKVIVPGKAVQLNYAMSSFGKEYIYTAVPAKGDTIPASPQPPVASSVPPIASKPPVVDSGAKYKADPAKMDTTMRDTALMQATDLAVAGKITVLEIPFYANQFYSWLKGGTCLLSMKEVKNVSEPSKPAITTAVVAKVEADKMENRGTEESPGTDNDKIEQRKQERIAFVERLKEHKWDVGKAVFTLNKTKKYNLSSIDNIPDYDVAYKVLKDLEKWEK